MIVKCLYVYCFVRIILNVQWMYLLVRLIDFEQVCKVDMECVIMYCYVIFNKVIRYFLREYYEIMKFCYGIKVIL